MIDALTKEQVEAIVLQAIADVGGARATDVVRAVAALNYPCSRLRIKAATHHAMRRLLKRGAIINVNGIWYAAAAVTP